MVLKSMDDLARTVNDILAESTHEVESICVHRGDVIGFIADPIHGNGNLTIHFAVPVHVYGGNEDNFVEKNYGNHRPKPGMVVVKHRCYSFRDV